LVARVTERTLIAPATEAPEWAKRAYWAIVETDISITDAAKAEGKHSKSLRYWIIAGEADRQKAKYRQWCRDNPEKTREHGRKGSKLRRQRHPAKVRAARKGYELRPENRGTCQSCGGMMGPGNPDDGTCAECIHKAKVKREQTIIRMWDEVGSIAEIAEALRTSVKVVQVTAARLRKRGVVLTDRRSR
jgi:hypothetical protein